MPSGSWRVKRNEGQGHNYCDGLNGAWDIACGKGERVEGGKEALG